MLFAAPKNNTFSIPVALALAKATLALAVTDAAAFLQTAPIPIASASCAMSPFVASVGGMVLHVSAAAVAADDVIVSLFLIG